MPSSSMRATISSGSQKLSVGSRRTFTAMPAAAMDPSHTSCLLDRKQLTSVSMMPADPGTASAAVIAEPLELGLNVHLGEVVEGARFDHLDRDLDPELVLERIGHLGGDGVELDAVGLAHD